MWNGACSGGQTLFQNTYDTTVLGTNGTTDFPVGQLTQSVNTTYYPDSSSATVTEQFQHDQRQRLTNEQIQLGLPSAWNVTAGLPTYQEAMSYNDANQVTTTSTTEGSAGYSFTSVYDPTNGVQQGLSNSSLSSANLATVSYNEYAQLSGITLLNGASSSPTNVATEQYGYDADQRPTMLSASWLPGSGNSGQIVGQSRSYDNQGNVLSLATTFAPVPGQTGSGGAQTENFCYDEMNRLVWSGNGGTQPGAGNGTCGSGTLNSTLTGSGYTAPYVYSNLGQIWQGPLSHQGTAQQYLYCNSTTPHQLTGIYPLGTTCATKGSATAVYSASYDPWGNQTSRTTGGVTGTLSYDQSNRMTEWNAGSNSQEFYVYDATGNRILKRSISSGTTSLAVYSFGLEEDDYSGTGVLSKQTDYYNLASHLIGSFNGTTTTYYMTDGLDSVITAFSQSAIQGEQVYGPFGASSYQSGTINTAKGYTGQVHDGVTGLDYYVARYYDPVMGMFLSVDTVQGNQQGMNPYTYVVDNPETATDPTGHAGTATCLDACPETTTETTAVLNDEQQVVNLFENPALTPVEVAASISLIAVSVAALSAIALIAFSVFLEWYVLTYHPKASTFYDGSKSSPAPTPAPTPGTGTTVSATPTATPATSTSGAGAFCGGSSACRDFVNRSMGWLTSSPNKLNHVFENNIHDHKWNLTGLSMAGNLDLIAQVIEAYYSRILVDPRGTLYTLRFGTYEVTVKGYYDPKTGIYQVNTAYVNP